MDDFFTYKTLERKLKHLSLLENYLRLNMKSLESEILQAQQEVWNQFYFFFIEMPTNFGCLVLTS